MGPGWCSSMDWAQGCEPKKRLNRWDQGHWAVHTILCALQCLVQGFSAVELLILGARSFFIMGSHPGHCKLFSSIPDFYQLNASSPWSVITTKNVSRHCQCPHGGKVSRADWRSNSEVAILWHSPSAQSPVSSLLHLQVPIYFEYSAYLSPPLCSPPGHSLHKADLALHSWVLPKQRPLSEFKNPCFINNKNEKRLAKIYTTDVITV